MTSNEILTTVLTIIPCTQQQANLKCDVDAGARTFTQMCQNLMDVQGLPKFSSEVQEKPNVKLTVQWLLHRQSVYLKNVSQK